MEGQKERECVVCPLANGATLCIGIEGTVIPIVGRVVVRLVKGKAEVLGYSLLRNCEYVCESAEGRPRLVLSGSPSSTPIHISRKYLARLFTKFQLTVEVPFRATFVAILTSDCVPPLLPLPGDVRGCFDYFGHWRTQIGKILLLSGPQRVLVMGSKNTGKSAFALYLLNACLSSQREVYTLDTDLGKPLFTLEGSVSLCKVLKPILSNKPVSQEVVRSYVINDTTPKNKPTLYLKSVLKLIQEHAKLQQTAGPSFLLVNTHGWTAGLGYWLLEEINLALKPTVVVSLETGQASDQSECEFALYSHTMRGLEASTNVVHLIQSNIKSYLQSAGKYKVKNVEELYQLSSPILIAPKLISYTDVSFVLPRTWLPSSIVLSKYQLLSIFNMQHVALVLASDLDMTKSFKAEDATFTLWNEEDVLQLQGVGYISNIDYTKGLIMQVQLYPTAESPMSSLYALFPLAEGIHPRWQAEDPASYVGHAYFYDSYSDHSYTASKKQLAA